MLKKIAAKWFKQAEHDLKMAEKNISIKGYDICAFLCQQAIEKLLKSILALQNKPIRKTHYIDELAKELGLSNNLVSMVNELVPDYTFARYPDVSEMVPFEEYDRETAEEKVKIAKNIFRRIIKQYKIREKLQKELK